MQIEMPINKRLTIDLPEGWAKQTPPTPGLIGISLHRGHESSKEFVCTVDP